MMRTIKCNRVTPDFWEYRWKRFFGECQTAKLGGTPAKDHERGPNQILGKASRAEQAEEVRKGEEEEKEREREKKKEKKKKRSPCLVRWRLCAKFTGFTGVANFSVR
jgi:hypothetical protein